uniref:Uncharacterized protein n=1 Tax=Anguilla anguilla TaxID=7936 RepID=A0A0E9W863_ANGAN
MTALMTAHVELYKRLFVQFIPKLKMCKQAFKRFFLYPMDFSSRLNSNIFS